MRIPREAVLLRIFLERTINFIIFLFMRQLS